MTRFFCLLAALLLAPLSAVAQGVAIQTLVDVEAKLTDAEAEFVTPSEATGWTPLFNGKDLTGWKASENPETFSVVDGLIVAHGDRAHLFYTGDVNGGEFKDFELWVEVKTEPGSNSGIYFHTAWQDEGWPMKGYEVQVNQTHTDPRKTGGLYAIVDVMDVSPVEDNEWYTEHITVKGKRVVVRVNGEVTVDYTEPAGAVREGRVAERLLDKGTFALQGHDPGSVVRYRQVWVKPLD
ncbi:hypothetical protein MalM25_36840 [Planctomycetes bacterium MalM25]|nr:hypothetical protein MalM25_36840 [Planctomycetes bacterium MalM25]